MDADNPLLNILFFLVAAVIAVPLFRRFGLGAILGYLFAGILVGPQGLNLIDQPESILHFSEIGVVLLLFIIGLELNPEKLWVMRNQIALLGGGQILVTTVVVAGFIFITVSPSTVHAVVIGLALALSSTAFAIQLMAEKGILASPEGRSGFAILLMQDLAVIPILFIVQSFALGGGDDSGGWWWGFVAVSALLISGRYLLDPMLGLIAKYGGRDIMTASSLMIVVGAALLMEVSGLSMGMGAFIAGIMLANSRFRHQLETEIEPFKALTLGLFFIAVGMTLDIDLFLSKPLLLLLAALALMSVKCVLIAGLFRLSGIPWWHGMHMGLLLSQGGEFAFVIMSQSKGLEILPDHLVNEVTLVVGLSMALTTPLVMVFERLTCSKCAHDPAEIDIRQDDKLEALILGFGRFGQITGRILSANRIPFAALDKDAAHIQFVSHFGNQIHFGDATRLDVLEMAGIANARVVVVAVDDPDEAERIVTLVRQRRPDATIIARARNRVSYLKLTVAGADKVLREVFTDSLNAATETLVSLGYSTSEALRTAEIFRQHDADLLDSAIEHHDDLERIIEIGQQGRRELEQLFSDDKTI